MLHSSFIGRALLAAVSSCLLAPAHAQTTQAVTVTATRTPLRANEVVADITVLDRAAIDKAQGRTLVELLSQQAGIQFSSNGGLGKTSSLFIRGLEARHTLLLVDGVRVGSVTVGSPSFDNLPLEAIDRIEIVRGPLSALYGSGAVGGVIQVFTRRGGKGLSANAKAVAGSHDFGQLSGGVGFGNGVFDLAAQVQHVETDGISATNARVPFGSFNPDRDGFRQTGGSLRLGWQPNADWRIELLGLDARGLTRLDDGPGVDSRAELYNRLGVVSARGRVLAGWDMRLSASQASDSYDTLASTSPGNLGVTRSKQKQFSWEHTIATPAGTLLALLDRLEEAVRRPGAPFAVGKRHIDGAALGLNGDAAGFTWQGSLRRDRNSQFGAKTTGAIGLGYAITPAWRAGASWGKSYVAPSFNQLYFPGFGNPLLVPEEGKHGEVSLRWTAGEHSVRAAYYRNRYRGFITSGPQPINLPRAEAEGETVSYEGRWRSVELMASWDHTDPRNATNANANFDKLLPRRAQNMLRLGADWTAGAFTVGATAVGFSHRFDNAANTARLGGYGTLDLRAEWAFSRELALGLKLNNVGGKSYETALGYNQPGREGFVTLRYAMR